MTSVVSRGRIWLAWFRSFFTKDPVLTGRVFLEDTIINEEPVPQPKPQAKVIHFKRKPGPAVYVSTEREFYLDSTIKRGSRTNVILRDKQDGKTLEMSEKAFEILFKLK